MGTRTERLRALQQEIARGPVPGGRRAPPLTRATENRATRKPGWGVATYILIVLAILSLIGATAGGGTSALSSAVVWCLLAWGNEVLRERQRRRAGR